jgi:hypothetical protein
MVEKSEPRLLQPACTGDSDCTPEFHAADSTEQYNKVLSESLTDPLHIN